MNLRNSPTREQLSALLASCDDRAAHHMIWVGYDAEVHIDAIPQGLTPSGFFQSMKESNKFRLETAQRGNSYVGKSASQDVDYVDRILRALIREWENGTVGYIDCF